ncbi:MAG: hypothetical protein IPK16_10445 [Anaerolineales bacterium]|nr:hypothetical protein [Anaerolineales bacterium]
METKFAYECTLSVPPATENPINNVVTVTWPGQALGNDTVLAAGSAIWTFSTIAFTENQIDECANVTDSYAGDLGQVCWRRQSNAIHLRTYGDNAAV